MNTETRQLLARWQSLERGDGLRRAAMTARVFWVLGFALMLLVVIGVGYGIHSSVVAVAAAAMGWTIAEANALQKRLALWPTMKRFIDWQHVREDLAKDSQPN